VQIVQIVFGIIVIVKRTSNLKCALFGEHATTTNESTNEKDKVEEEEDKVAECDELKQKEGNGGLVEWIRQSLTEERKKIMVTLLPSESANDRRYRARASDRGHGCGRHRLVQENSWQVVRIEPWLAAAADGWIWFAERATAPSGWCSG
jgi:hypothetical protein